MTQAVPQPLVQNRRRASLIRGSRKYAETAVWIADSIPT